ncbi:ATP-binding cassette domain-containing protein [Dactylosporangium roseum]|uniref:ATP-binding cassette domain-containing protein n=1 Tax=Dactylosporangium roseum TaxID=47989 RepID=A0ABY5Z0B9_9ACTN|nr:oligopeptide/dipeptide ABC transporter ATP-binding protein [Dactylosporangium roseum]UWZ34317.1 ATP-binding cassette domain-containing protein [Dactylosporangium roseum]
MPDVPLLEVRDLVKHFTARPGRGRVTVAAVDGVAFALRHGETLGLVGESGSGKSTIGRLVTRLLRPDRGEILLAGRDVATLSVRAMRPYRRDVQLVFQDPYSSLNPRHTVGDILGMALRVHDTVPKAQVASRIRELLGQVGLEPAHAGRYPHEFSGGQRQRIGIARALAVQPRLIVADEPVSALDVSIQAQVMNLLEDLRADLGLAFLFISHDLAVVRHFCDRVAVLYRGRIVEIGGRDQIYADPRHPYTQTLLAAVPDIAWLRGGGARRSRAAASAAPAAELGTQHSGCRFRARCPVAAPACAESEPALTVRADGHLAACHVR